MTLQLIWETTGPFILAIVVTALIAGLCMIFIKLMPTKFLREIARILSVGIIAIGFLFSVMFFAGVWAQG